MQEGISLHAQGPTGWFPCLEGSGAMTSAEKEAGSFLSLCEFSGSRTWRQSHW